MITRRDFLNGVLLGSGSRLLAQAPPADNPAWDGPGGVGDYASSPGNPWRVMEAAHRIRDGQYAAEKLPAEDTRETFDLIIVGAGMSGLGAALYFQKHKKPGQTCLIFDNHPIFGGESKRNEFIVDGQRLVAPQGANEFDIPTDPKSDGYGIFEQLRIPRRFEYQEWPEELDQLEFDRTNYGFQHWIHAPSFGNNIDGKWVRDFYGAGHASADLQKWNYHRGRYYRGADLGRWLDTMTYQDYIEKVMGLSSEVTAYAHPILAAAMGLGCDALSAYAAYQITLPGFQGFAEDPAFPVDFEKVPETEWHMFPGGNTGFARYIVKTLIPDSIPGKHALPDITMGGLRYRALDRRGAPFRIRLGATVVRVELSHDQNPSRDRKGAEVIVTYEKGGKLYSVCGRGVVMAGGSWATRHIVRDLPADKREAFNHFFHSPVLVFNVAVRHWRFLYDLGLTGARWTSGFGFSCNVRRQMVMPGYRPKLHPDAPTVITFYIPLYYPGLPAREQGAKGRLEMLSTSFAEYEEKIRDQIRKLFGKLAVKAIAGTILNRWGHAYVNPTPGFYFGRSGKPAPPDVIRKPFGRIAFAHSELFGHQFWLGAIREGRRAVRQL
jgi:spermidine dehydrogenase